MSGEELERLEAELREIRRLVTQSSLRLAPAALSMEEAAQMLSCSSRHISRMVKRGLLRVVDVGGLNRIPVSQIHALLERGVPPPARETMQTRPRYDAAAASARLRELRMKR